MIETVRDIVSAAEAGVAGCVPMPWPWLNRIVRVIAPGLLFARGARDFGKQVLRVAAWAAIAAAVGFLISSAEPASRPLNAALMALLGGLAALMSAPSDLSRMIDQKAVQNVVELLQDRDVRSQEQLDALVSAVIQLERRPTSRIAGLKWLVGAAWAAAVYAFAQGLAAAVGSSITQAHLELGLWAAFIASVLYVIGRLYSLTNELVFEAVYLGFAEYRYRLATQSPNMRFQQNAASV